jgi:predicted nucleotidyltransferase
MNPESVNIQPILDRIAEIVRQEMKGNYRLFLFGSRAGDGHDSKADIDIGIIADKPVEARTMVTIKESLEQIPTLLKIDFVDFSSVSQDFRKIAMKKTKDINS